MLFLRQFSIRGHISTVSEKQLATALTVARSLVQVYDLKDILGHDDVAPDRKTDPGPPFLWWIFALIFFVSFC